MGGVLKGRKHLIKSFNLYTWKIPTGMNSFGQQGLHFQLPTGIFGSHDLICGEKVKKKAYKCLLMRDPLDAAWSTALASCAEQGKPGWTQNHLQTVLHTWGHCSSDPWAEEGGDKITAIPQTTSEFSYSVPPPADHLLSSGNTTNGEGLQVSKEENSKWQSQSWAHYSLINLAKPFPFWNRIPGMDVINKETDKNYLWMNLSISRPRHSQEMPSTSNQPFILNSHHFLLLFPVQN